MFDLIFFSLRKLIPQFFEADNWQVSSLCIYLFMCIFGVEFILCHQLFFFLNGRFGNREYDL